MKWQIHIPFDPPRARPVEPIQLSYGHADRLGPLRGEANAMADSLGGWNQVAYAGVLIVPALVLAVVTREACFSSFIGVVGLSAGLFGEAPLSRPDWHAFLGGILAAVAVTAVGWMVGRFVVPHLVLGSYLLAKWAIGRHYRLKAERVEGAGDFQ